MSKSKIIKTLQSMNWLSKHWRIKDFVITEDKDKIIFSYYHGDMGLIDKVKYSKKDGYTEIYVLNNYYGTEDIYTTLYI